MLFCFVVFPPNPYRTVPRHLGHMLYMIKCHVSFLDYCHLGKLRRNSSCDTFGGLMFRLRKPTILVGDVMIQTENSGSWTRPAHSPKSPSRDATYRDLQGTQSTDHSLYCMNWNQSSRSGRKRRGERTEENSKLRHETYGFFFEKMSKVVIRSALSL